MTAPRLSVVIAEAGGWPAAEPALASVLVACRGIDTELILVRSQTSDLPTPPVEVPFQVVDTAPGTLVPVQWGAGVAISRGAVVACLTTELTVTPTWARQLLDTMQAGAVGAGSAIGLADAAAASTCGMYLVRFASFLPNTHRDRTIAREVPGDGAMYDRTAITEHDDLLRHGFWEVEFHRRWLGQGRRLVQSGDPMVVFHGRISLGGGMLSRYRHGVQYGASMVQSHGHGRLRHVLGAPVLPFVLTGRVLRRALQSDIPRSTVMRGLLPVLALATAWSAGECVGALQAWRRQP